MNSKVIAVAGYSIFFLTLYFLFGGLWFGVALLNTAELRPWLVAFYAIAAAGITVWFLRKALDESKEIAMRKLDATASLSLHAVCITCIAMLLMPETLLHTEVLLFAFRVSCVFVGTVLIGAAVTLALSTFREEKRS